MIKVTTISTKLCLAVAAAFLLGISSSHASLMLRVTDSSGPTVVTATDQVVGGGVGTTDDLSNTLGFLSTNFSTPNFLVVSSSGASQPLPPNSNVHANLDLLQIAITATTDGWLTIELSDNNFNLGGIASGNGFMHADIGGTLGQNAANSVQMDYYYNTSNALFDTVGATHLGGSFSGGGAFSGSFGPAAVGGANNPFSLTQVATIHMKAGQVLSFDSDFHVVPEPSMLALLGLGLLGFAGSRRLNKK